MTKQELEDFLKLDYCEWYENAELTDSETLFNKCQEFAKLVLKQATDLKNQTEIIKEYREEVRRLKETNEKYFARIQSLECRGEINKPYF